MTRLAGLTVVAASALAALSAPCLLAPAQAVAAARRFPRSKWPAWIMTAIALVWSANLLYEMPMGPVNKYKTLLYVLTPATFLLTIRFMDELLAPRALGGLALLLARPLLDAARFPDSAFQISVSVFGYLVVIAGMILVMNPYQFRKAAEVLLKNERRGRFCGIAGAALALFFLALGLSVF